MVKKHIERSLPLIITESREVGQSPSNESENKEVEYRDIILKYSSLFGWLLCALFV